MLAKDLSLPLRKKVLPNVSSYFASPKIDGMRCFWDGGTTKQLLVKEVPWANVDKEHATNHMRSTGLWSRGGRPIMCPDWFTKGWPNILMDGELVFKGYVGPFASLFHEPMHPDLFKDHHQKILSAVKKHEPRDDEWENIALAVFDSPSWTAFTEKRELDWNQRNRGLVVEPLGYRITDHFSEVYEDLLINVLKNPVTHKDTVTCFLLKQIKVDNVAHFENLCETAYSAGGEGIILRKDSSFWYPKRWDNVIKVKDIKDSEATVIGYEYGKEGLRNENRLGSLVVNWNNGPLAPISFNIGIGFTDEERDNFRSLFPVGSVITFKYRALTDSGVPKEARYHRKREQE